VNTYCFFTQPQRRKLVELLGEIWPELEIVALCEDGLSALESVTSLQPTARGSWP
jgi:hypothetical protein